MKKEIMILGVHHLDSPNNGDLYSLEMNVKSNIKRSGVNSTLILEKILH